MEQVLAILIIVPTAAALLLVAVYIIGTVLGLFAAGVDGAVTGIRHRLHPAQDPHRTHYTRPALHH